MFQVHSTRVAAWAWLMYLLQLTFAQSCTSLLVIMLARQLAMEAARAAIRSKPSPPKRPGMHPSQNGKRRASTSSSSSQMPSSLPTAAGISAQDNPSISYDKSIIIPQLHIDNLQWIEDDDESPPLPAVSATRKLVLATANECLAKQNAASTIATYESLLNSLVGDAQRQLQTTLLPLDTNEKFLSLFSFLKAKDPDLKWSRVQSLKSALVKYHARTSSLRL